MQPTTHIAGDSLSFLVSTPSYSAADGWVLKYRLVPRTVGGAVIELTATAESADHRVQAPAAATANWVADDYTWASWVERTGEKHTVDRGQIVVQPDPRTLPAGHDGRSQALRALEQLRAAFATFSASKGTVRRYKIGEREMEFNAASEILMQIRYWEQQLANETAAANLAKGLAPKNRILTRFSRVR